MSQFATEEEFEQWFHGRYGHYSRDWHQDRGLPYPGDEMNIPTVRDRPLGDERRRSAIQALIDRGATEGERDAARAAMARLEAQDEADYLDAVRAGEA